MSLSAWEQQALESIKHGLAGSDPELATLLAAFTELASGQDMPVRESLQASSRASYALVIWLLVTAVMIGLALALSSGDSQASCTVFWPASCSHPVPASSPVGITWPRCC